MDVQFPDATALVQDPATGAVHLNAQATGPVSSQVPFSAVLGADGAETTLSGEVTETTRGPVATRIQSFTAGGQTWTISEDGLSATPPAS